MNDDNPKHVLWQTIKANYFQESTLLVAILLIIGVFSLLSESFLTINNLLNILLQISIIAILGFGVTIVIISGGIDLSLGSVLALTGMVTAIVLKHSSSIPLAIGSGLFTGLLIGFINGFSIVYFKLPAFIATLAMLSVARGISLVATNAVPVYDLPQSFLFLGAGSMLGIPVPVYIMATLFVVMHIMLNSTCFGRYIYAIGGNEEATRLSGINVNYYKLWIYILCGVCTGIAGILFTARLGSGQPTAGVGYELDAITAAILGGTNLFGGAGTLIGTLIGALAMGLINNGQALMNVNSYTQLIIKGVVVMIAVGISALRYKK